MPRVVRSSSSPSATTAAKPRTRRTKSKSPPKPALTSAEARSSTVVEMPSAKAFGGSLLPPPTPSFEAEEDEKKNASTPLHEGALQSWASARGARR